LGINNPKIHIKVNVLLSSSKNPLIFVRRILMPKNIEIFTHLSQTITGNIENQIDP